VGVSCKETADVATKEALEEEIQHYEKYPPQNLMKWMKNKHQEEQQGKWERSTSTMKVRKSFSKRILYSTQK
jgi:hypothetical protein